MEVVRDGGKLITVSGDSDQVVPERAIAVSQMGHHADTQQKVVELVDALARGEIKIVVEKEYSFEQALEALQKTETRHARGKLVVRGLQ
jgi:NADPH:quinone reductase-like Zn-dependent oxidoreductase